MRDLCTIFLGAVLLAAVAGCDQSSEEVTLPKNVPPPPSKNSVKFSAPAASPSSPQQEIRVAR